MNQLKVWQRVQAFIDVRSGAVMSILFFYMIGLITYCELTGKPLQSEAVVFALGVLGLKTGHTILSKGDSNGQS